MTIAELQFVRRLVDSGTTVSVETWARVLKHAIEVTVSASPTTMFEHDESCTGWVDGPCDCPHRTVST